MAISKYTTEDSSGHAITTFNSKTMKYDIEYYDNTGTLFFNEDVDKLEDAQTLASDWAAGSRSLYEEAA
jgi:hypothetical protein